jgi:hypothetical protein
MLKDYVRGDTRLRAVYRSGLTQHCPQRSYHCGGDYFCFTGKARGLAKVAGRLHKFISDDKSS